MIGVVTVLTFLATAHTGSAQANHEVEEGAKVFKRVCSMCHTSDAGKNKIGPSLFSVIGRKSGTVPGFTYSEAMKTANITWNDQTIGKYIADPKKVVPGNKMTYIGLKKEAERQEIVAYLNTLH